MAALARPKEAPVWLSNGVSPLMVVAVFVLHSLRLKRQTKGNDVRKTALRRKAMGKQTGEPHHKAMMAQVWYDDLALAPRLSADKTTSRPPLKKKNNKAAVIPSQRQWCWTTLWRSAHLRSKYKKERLTIG